MQVVVLHTLGLAAAIDFFRDHRHTGNAAFPNDGVVGVIDFLHAACIERGGGAFGSFVHALEAGAVRTVAKRGGVATFCDAQRFVEDGVD